MPNDSYPLIVKWGKETLEVNLVVDAGVKGLKQELEAQTGVPSDRMKLMAKSKGLWKGVLKDDQDLTAIDFEAASKKNKALQCLLVGSATQVAAPKIKTVFVEDLPPDEIAKHVEPSGLVNLGNTCYMNSVVQCLRATPLLRKGLETYQIQQQASNPQAFFLKSLQETYHNLDRTAEAVPPSSLVRATKMSFPQFAQLGPQGQPMQQDAEEFYSGLLTIAAGELTSPETGFGKALSAEELQGATNLVDAAFGIPMEETLTCDECPQEAPTTTQDLHRKLVCNIQGGSDGSATTNVSHIQEGIALSLQGKIEKHSDVLGRNALWTRQQRLSRLPPVLVVQFGRFYWKATPDSQDHAGVKCKVMKPVAFHSTLDVYEYCTEKVQKILKQSRDRALAEEEARINAKLEGQGKEEAKTQDGDGDDKMEQDDPEEAAALKEALALSMMETDDEPPLGVVGPGLPERFQGIYELFAVVTHKGRNADGGHYMGWVKADSSRQSKAEKIADTDEMNEDWYVFDDDEVSPCKTEDVLKLKGGGDWHMSYLNFYRAKK